MGVFLFPVANDRKEEHLCPECQSISRKNGHSFLMIEVGRNTTSFARNVKGAASKADNGRVHQSSDNKGMYGIRSRLCVMPFSIFSQSL